MTQLHEAHRSGSTNRRRRNQDSRGIHRFGCIFRFEVLKGCLDKLDKTWDRGWVFRLKWHILMRNAGFKSKIEFRVPYSQQYGVSRVSRIRLYVTRSDTSSHCKLSCNIWVRPWSKFRVSLTTRAAAFITRCRVSVTDFVAPEKWSTCYMPSVTLNSASSLTHPSQPTLGDSCLFLFISRSTHSFILRRAIRHPKSLLKRHISHFDRFHLPPILFSPTRCASFTSATSWEPSATV